MRARARERAKLGWLQKNVPSEVIIVVIMIIIVIVN